jgi:hypothetical protein
MEQAVLQHYRQRRQARRKAKQRQRALVCIVTAIVERDTAVQQIIDLAEAIQRRQSVPARRLPGNSPPPEPA